METRANYVLIGAFTLAVIAAAFGFVLWFQSLHTTKQRSPIRIVFEGPASGLRNGGSVNFNGIRIGEVVSVKLDNPRRVVALAMVENNAPIRKDTLVGLEFQGLTGVAAISLKGGEENALAVPLDEDGVPMLTADPSALQDVTESIRATLQNVNRLVADNQESVKNSLRNLETFTAALARNSEKIDNVMALKIRFDVTNALRLPGERIRGVEQGVMIELDERFEGHTEALAIIEQGAVVIRNSPWLRALVMCWPRSSSAPVMLFATSSTREAIASEISAISWRRSIWTPEMALRTCSAWPTRLSR